MRMNTGFIRHAGNYQQWNVYRKAVIVCDVTEMFITRYLPTNSRTIDQMRQAARSCKQNIVEGTCDGSVSIEMCIKLLGIARGSLRELLEDYRDFLRQRKLPIWSIDDDKTKSTREFCRKNDIAAVFVEKCESRTEGTVANIMITVICQLDCMIAKTIDRYEESFIREGGIKEKMSATRRVWRKENLGY
ncbi:MAG: four helix bundle suffix domain-containing protein [Muribaculaceae bacterium]|nr:four helix bundle suffix domain-containing protein [Muribaculaceae bacterium]